MKLQVFSSALLALLLAACSTYEGGYSNSGYRTSSCYDCGVVQDINSYSGERRATGAGAVAGAIVGGAIGSQVGSGDGKKAATVAGAVVGGIAGHNIEKNAGGTWHEVTVRMDDGRVVVVTQDDLNGVRVGSRVVVRDGRARLR